MKHIFGIVLTALMTVVASASQVTLLDQTDGNRYGPIDLKVGGSFEVHGHVFRIAEVSSNSMEEQMKKVVIPAIEFRKAVVQDVLDYLIELADAYQGNGVSIVIDKHEASASDKDDPWGFGDETPDDLESSPTITMTLRNVSLYEALNIVCGEAKLMWNVENGVLVVRPLVVPQEESYSKKLNDWEYDGEFQKLTALADKIVIRDGGYNCCGPVDDQKVLVTITDPQEIKAFNDLFEFEPKQKWGKCMCCGHPGSDWYAGDYRLALTAMQHGQALRWRDFPGDAALTAESAKKLAAWMQESKLPDPQDERKKLLGEVP